mmetsp:Transcript_1623/g.2473  ORF Transcript_1623/g.2473 Transcript_1623/m.2473 type:complete len:128 (-) Transcript_1623:97-480(-)
MINLLGRVCVGMEDTRAVETIPKDYPMITAPRHRLTSRPSPPSPPRVERNLIKLTPDELSDASLMQKIQMPILSDHYEARDDIATRIDTFQLQPRDQPQSFLLQPRNQPQSRPAREPLMTRRTQNYY